MKTEGEAIDRHEDRRRGHRHTDRHEGEATDRQTDRHEGEVIDTQT